MLMLAACGVLASPEFNVMNGGDSTHVTLDETMLNAAIQVADRRQSVLPTGRTIKRASSTDEVMIRAEAFRARRRSAAPPGDAANKPARSSENVRYSSFATVVAIGMNRRAPRDRDVIFRPPSSLGKASRDTRP